MQWEASALEDGEAESVSIMGPGSVANLAEAATCLPEGMGIVSGVGGIFTLAWMLLGFDRFCCCLVDNPELVARTFARIRVIQCAVLRKVV